MTRGLGRRSALGFGRRRGQHAGDPGSASGAEKLFDAFSALSGVNYDAATRAMGSTANQSFVIWAKDRTRLRLPGQILTSEPSTDVIGVCMSTSIGGGTITDHVNWHSADGCKQGRLADRHRAEKFGWCKDSLKPLPYAGKRSIQAVLEGLRDHHGWSEVLEKGYLIGLEKDGANVSLEPGGALELSGAPLQTIHETCDEVNQHLKEVKSIADEIGVGFIGLGAAPIWTHDQMPLMPKGRYKLMNDYMQRVGTVGTTMMRRTCTVQVISISPRGGHGAEMRVAIALQPMPPRSLPIRLSSRAR